MSKRATYPALEPYFLFLLFVGIGLGTILLDQAVRLALLWSTLAILCVAYWAGQKLDIDLSLTSMGRGALLGLVISIPLLAFLAGQLRAFTERLYATQDVVTLFYQICFISAPVEECFFRGIIQEQKGSSVSIALYAVTALLLFLPYTPLLGAFAMFIAIGVLGIVYSYTYDRYGLPASIACHIVVGFIMQVAPSLIETLRTVLS